ncbi:4-hydroxyphenylpyruvate dioxygenase [Salinactinospora qingdaonensis]|uniref:4-hydroxyphenylpyruvate dioxygenase n=1 Tax=Salinactinospora qingdaonensis TaxID=702744 RepID=A0ABP7FX24_9ACTN
MANSTRSAFEDINVDHIRFYVNDIAAAQEWLVDGYGFAVQAGTAPSETAAEARSVGLGRGRIRLVLTEPLLNDHPGRAYVERHGDGVADIALRVHDATAAFNEAMSRGARPVAPPVNHGGIVTATIMGFADVAHTFVQRSPEAEEQPLPGLRPADDSAAPGWDSGLRDVDHFAVCLEAGQLDPTVEFYEHLLDFEMVFTERIVVGAQAMNSKVVQSRSGAVTLTLIEPDVSREPGQIDGFLKNHGGAGVQHVAFTADSIVESVGAINAAGIDFLNTPETYYSMLADRLTLSRHSVDDLRRLGILVDEDQDGQLFQIFSQSIHPQKTFFVELIERMGAQTFGSGNIKALYEAVEAQRAQDGDAA